MQRRNRRASVEDLWRDRTGQPTKLAGTGKRWRARYVDTRGKELTKRFDRKRDAQAFLDNINTSISTGAYAPPSKQTVRQLHTQLLASQPHLKPTTRNNRESTWRKHLEPRWASVVAQDITKPMVVTWIGELIDSELGVPTIENAFHLLKQVLDVRSTVGNPCIGVKLPQRTTKGRGYLSHKQVDLLANKLSDVDTAVVYTLAYTGIRWGELAALQVRAVDHERRRLDIHRAMTEVKGQAVFGTTKTSERRSVPFPNFLASTFTELTAGKGLDDLVFTTNTGSVLRVSTWRPRVFNPAVMACEFDDPTFPRITPHDLRHTAASLAVQAKASVLAVQRMLGHAKPSMTLDVYSDLFDTDLDAVSTAMDEARETAAYSLRTQKAEKRPSK